MGSILALFLWMRFKGERVVLELRAPLYLLPATGFVVLAWFTDALRLSLTTGVWEKRISLRNAFTVVLATHFLAGITPSNTGGGAVEIYLLHRLGMSWGEASSLSLSCGLLYQAGFLVLFLLAPASVSFSLFSRTILAIFLAYGAGLTSFFILSQNQKVLPGIIEKAVMLPKKYFPRYATYEEKAVVSAAQSFLQELRSGFQLLFLKKPHYAVLNIAFYALHFFFLFSVTTFVVRSLGLTFPLFEAVKLQIPAFFLFRLTPTPGGSGGI
ncbi:MAG: lysylphosphatidylglycerol synthase transmembrane domain-containing protein, partial [Candidatus Caldatribacteriaceae bacterium]